VVLSEALDRVSRDQEDIAHIYKHLKFADIRFVTLSEGDIDEMHIGLKGTMNSLFLKELARKTKRGLEGRALQGKSVGGKALGYQTVKQFNGKGEVIEEERRIVPDEAEIVKRIFADFLKGKSPRKIAFELNQEKIPSPSGNGWGSSTINGNRRRGTGILNNELYIGLMVWNRLTYKKDPTTRKRISRFNPESEWVTIDLPELRIIDQETWDAVKSYQRKLDAQPTFNTKKRQPISIREWLIAMRQPSRN
jgi:site-specific DNA recombinase